MTAKQLAIIILVLAAGRAVLFFYPNINLVNQKFKQTTVEYLDSIVVAGITALFIIHFLFRTFYIPSGSMIPTLQIRDYIIVNEFIYRVKKPQRGDIVVFTPPPAANAGDKEFIKRVVGLGGETIEIIGGKVFIDGEKLKEDYVKYPADYHLPPQKIPPGNLFVMGDNRPSSADSHIWGFLPEKNLIGRASVIILPFNRIRLLHKESRLKNGL
ncbi:MAG: signal peptidase I [Vulcanimicrobiota bacterium]